MTPAFVFASGDQTTGTAYPWGDSISIMPLSMGILVTTAITYQMIFGFGKRSSGGSQLVVISLAFLFFSIFGLEIPPLQEFSIVHFGMLQTTVPLILIIVVFPLYVLIVPYGMMLVIIPFLGYTYKKFFFVMKHKQNNYHHEKLVYSNWPIQLPCRL